MNPIAGQSPLSSAHPPLRQPPTNPVQIPPQALSPPQVPLHPKTSTFDIYRSESGELTINNEVWVLRYHNSHGTFPINLFDPSARNEIHNHLKIAIEAHLRREPVKAGEELISLRIHAGFTRSRITRHYASGAHESFPLDQGPALHALANHLVQSGKGDGLLQQLQQNPPMHPIALANLDDAENHWKKAALYSLKGLFRTLPEPQRESDAKEFWKRAYDDTFTPKDLAYLTSLAAQDPPTEHPAEILQQAITGIQQEIEVVANQNASIESQLIDIDAETIMVRAHRSPTLSLDPITITDPRGNRFTHELTAVISRDARGHYQTHYRQSGILHPTTRVPIDSWWRCNEAGVQRETSHDALKVQFAKEGCQLIYRKVHSPSVHPPEATIRRKATYRLHSQSRRDEDKWMEGAMLLDYCAHLRPQNTACKLEDDSRKTIRWEPNVQGFTNTLNEALNLRTGNTAHQIVMMPLFIPRERGGGHFVLAIFDKANRHVLYFDSCGKKLQEASRIFRDLGYPSVTNVLEGKAQKWQNDGWACGYHVLFALEKAYAFIDQLPQGQEGLTEQNTTAFLDEMRAYKEGVLNPDPQRPPLYPPISESIRQLRNRLKRHYNPYTPNWGFDRAAAPHRPPALEEVEQYRYSS